MPVPGSSGKRRGAQGLTQASSTSFAQTQGRLPPQRQVGFRPRHPRPGLIRGTAQSPGPPRNAELWNLGGGGSASCRWVRLAGQGPDDFFNVHNLEDEGSV